MKKSSTTGSICFDEIESIQGATVVECNNGPFYKSTHYKRVHNLVLKANAQGDKPKILDRSQRLGE